MISLTAFLIYNGRISRGYDNSWWLTYVLAAIIGLQVYNYAFDRPSGPVVILIGLFILRSAVANYRDMKNFNRETEIVIAHIHNTRLPPRRPHP